jgi:major membrane immunogen (membrane-anchored lipoprotein)
MKKMKPNVICLMTGIIALSVMLTGCDKRNGGDNGGGYVINAQVEDRWGFNDRIATVQALMYRDEDDEDDDKIAIASCKLENG